MGETCPACQQLVPEKRYCDVCGVHMKTADYPNAPGHGHISRGVCRQSQTAHPVKRRAPRRISADVVEDFYDIASYDGTRTTDNRIGYDVPTRERAAKRLNLDRRHLDRILYRNLLGREATP